MGGANPGNVSGKISFFYVYFALVGEVGAGLYIFDRSSNTEMPSTSFLFAKWRKTSGKVNEDSREAEKRYYRGRDRREMERGDDKIEKERGGGGYGEMQATLEGEDVEDEEMRWEVG